MNYHVFNGDADGLCAVHQLLLDNPVRTELVTGLKRDIRLLERIKAQAGERVKVLDISLNSNRAALMQLLEAGVAVDMYGEGRQAHHPDEASRYSGELKKNLPLAKKRFEAALHFLQKQENVDSRNMRRWAIVSAAASPWKWLARVKI